MTAKKDNFGIKSWLPMSYRGRAEAFARSLQTKLRSLGPQDGNCADETNWSTKQDTQKLVQPEVVYLDYGPSASPEIETPYPNTSLDITNNGLSNGKHPTEESPTTFNTAQDINENLIREGIVNNGDNAKEIVSNALNVAQEENDYKAIDCENAPHLISDEAPQNETKYNIPEAIIDNDIMETCDELINSLGDFKFTAEIISESDNQLASLENVTQAAKISAQYDETADEIDCAIGYKTAEVVSEECLTKFHPPIAIIDSVPQLELCNENIKLEECLLSRLELPNCNEISDNDDDDSEFIIPRVRRCSSLKTGKTPPGTPSRKKIVRFADVLGLDLADVRTFLDDVPNVPNSAYRDLNDLDVNEANAWDISKLERTLLILFQQPGGQENFLEKVQIKNVMLENAVLEDPIAFSIRGLVRVKNLDYNKFVYIRYSLDSWKSFADVKATYVENSSDGFTDKFSFLLYAYTLQIGQRLEFAVRFQCEGGQYWDNNGGHNYCFQCLPASNPKPYTPISTGMDDQIATFYYQNIEPKTEDAELTRTIVQDYIMNSLQKNKARESREINSGKPELVTIFIILFFSIVFLYLKKAITIF